MVRVRLRLAYDGGAFSGWAAQPGLRTVQGQVQAALACVTRRAEAATVPVTVAGRTDAGVHARGQVAHFDLSEAELERWNGRAAQQLVQAEGECTEAERALELARVRRLNGVLRRQGDEDITVFGAEIVSNDFDARFSALWRRYEYRVREGECDPLERHMTVGVRGPLDRKLLREASASLCGFRDFAAFCKKREGATTLRTLTHFDWSEPENGLLVARIQADAFCHSMVRSLVGAALAVASAQLTPEELTHIVQLRERSSRFAVMPARGLSLEEIAYPEAGEYAARAAQTRARRIEPDCAP